MLDYLKQKLARISVALITALSLTSCVEMEQEYIINPDGSGKLKITQAVAMPDLGALGTEKNDSQKQENPIARKMLVTLLNAEGIEAWSDVKYEVGKDGKTRVQATGYFADVSKVQVSGGMNEKGKQGSGISKDSAGCWVLDMRETLAQAKEKQSASTSGEESTSTLTDEEITAKIEEQRQQFAMQKAMMQAMLSTMKVTTTISGGGTIEEAKGAFVKKGDNSASFTITGTSMIDAISKILEDDEKIRKLIKAGQDPLQSSDPSELLTALGLSEDSKVVLKPTKPAFDYATEVADAKKNVSPELKQLLQEAKEEAHSSE